MAIHFSLAIACALVFSALTAAAGELTLQELQVQMKRAGATWAAGEYEVKPRLGAILPEGFGENWRPAVETKDRSLPAALDWRNKDGVNYASPILNQGSCGSCVAFAAVSTMETQMNITRKTPS